MQARVDNLVYLGLLFVWKSLPAQLRSASISHAHFRDGLKIHLLLQAYTWSSEDFTFKSVFTYLLTYLQW